MENGFRPLFDGKTLAGWRGSPRHWRVENGVITAGIPAGQGLRRNQFLVYEDSEFGDFTLRFQFQIAGHPTANSGVQIRSRRLPDGGMAGYQADLDKGRLWLGRIYDEHGRKLLVERGARVTIAKDGTRKVEKSAAPETFANLLRPESQWNDYEVKAEGSRLEVRVNGEPLSVLDDRQEGEADATGKIAFQLHSGPGPVRLAFRHIRVRETAKVKKTTATTPPNVIVFLTDDLGYGDIASHGNPVLRTPNFDRLRAESVRFTDFHVAPMCSPTRGQLLTGVDALRNGCTAVCEGRSMIRREFPLMPEFFQRRGYATGHFGKWHLGDSYPHRPQDRGFEETIHHQAWGIGSLADPWKNSYFDPILSHNGRQRKFKGYCTDIFFNEAMRWIGSVKTKNQEQGTKNPFFLYLPTNTPHKPDISPEEFAKRYRGHHQGKTVPAHFYGMIANLDENLGRLETFLAEQGLRENTIFIFLSDNGTQHPQAQAIYNAGMRDRKRSVYDGGHRVPCYVRWPAGSLAHGQDIAELTQVQDLLPTLIDLCELDAGATFDGTSLSGLLRGTQTELPDRKLVIQYLANGNPWNAAAVLWDQWRLVKRDELYHIGRDPGQKTNVAKDHPKIVTAMQSHYDQWYAKAKPQFDRPRWITIGSEKSNPMTLYAQDWQGDYCDNIFDLRKATGRGHWNVIVDRPGTYEFELRRWSRDSGKTLTEGIAGPSDKGRTARPIAKAAISIAGLKREVTTKPGETHATFTLDLPAGKHQLATLFSDADDKPLCSAIYVYLKRVTSDEKATNRESSSL